MEGSNSGAGMSPMRVRYLEYAILSFAASNMETSPSSIWLMTCAALMHLSDDCGGDIGDMMVLAPAALQATYAPR